MIIWFLYSMCVLHRKEMCLLLRIKNQPTTSEIGKVKFWKPITFGLSQYSKSTENFNDKKKSVVM